MVIYRSCIIWWYFVAAGLNVSYLRIHVACRSYNDNFTSAVTLLHGQTVGRIGWKTLTNVVLCMIEYQHIKMM